MSPTLLNSSRVRDYLSERVVVHGDRSRMRVALTFDDGPNPTHTPQILDVLARHDLRATFFLLGYRVRRYPELARAIADAGHELAVHGQLHLPWVLLPPPVLRAQVKSGRNAIQETTGRSPRFCRPPFGWISPAVLQVLRELGLRPVIGDVYPEDSRRPGVDTIVRRVMDRVQPGSIVILHDGGWHDRVDRSQTVQAVEELATALDRRQLQCSVLQDLLPDTGHPSEGDGQNP